MENDTQAEIIDALRLAVWQKAIGNAEITHGSYYWKKISHAIEESLGSSMQLHPDTIRNFFKGQHQPRQETLDILSWYVLGDGEAVQQTFVDFTQNVSLPLAEKKHVSSAKRLRLKWISSIGILLLVAISAMLYLLLASPTKNFSEDFLDVSEEALAKNGWFLQDPDTAFWKLRAEKDSFLTLYTLRGDNWVGDGEQPFLKNRLTRRVYLGDTYQIEFELRDFFPNQNWQQCGILLMEDSSLSSAILRIAPAYAQFGDPLLSYLSLQTAQFEPGDHHRPKEYSSRYLVVPVDSFELYRPSFKYIVIRLKVEHGVFSVFTSFGSRFSFSFVERIKDVSLDFHPRFLALYAAGAQVDFRQPDTIPARFERISIINF